MIKQTLTYWNCTKQTEVKSPRKGQETETHSSAVRSPIKTLTGSCSTLTKDVVQAQAGPVCATSVSVSSHGLSSCWFKRGSGFSDGLQPLCLSPLPQGSLRPEARDLIDFLFRLDVLGFLLSAHCLAVVSAFDPICFRRKL